MSQKTRCRKYLDVSLMMCKNTGSGCALFPILICRKNVGGHSEILLHVYIGRIYVLIQKFLHLYRILLHVQGFI